MASSMGKALSGLSKPGKSVAAKRGTASMTIEAAPKTFTDRNLDPKMQPAAPGRVAADNAKSGSNIGPNPNAPVQVSSKKNPTGITKT